MNVKKSIIACIFTAILVSGIWAGVITKQSYESGRVCDQYREYIYRAETENRRLRESVEGIRNICGELNELTDRNISTAREAIESIEQIREGVVQLEIMCGYFDWDKYYYDTDSYLGLEN